jgi:quinohemoprotein ethanol dehydrogenase
LRFAGAAALLVCAAAATAANLSPLSPDLDPRNWSAIGRAGETHYSPLTEINRETVGRLKLAWSVDLDVGNAQATPLAVDGIIYVAAGYSIVSAVDAQTGKVLWRFDPGVTQVAGKKLRAGSGVRGLAYSLGRLFVGTHDGRLIALDAKKGTQVWSTPTLEANDATFISGAPRVFKDRVAIGFGDSGVTPGRVSAFDVATGKQVWNWTTQGGGGAVWNAITYDPESNRLYAGTGNARGADAAKNVFACSVVALNADSGALEWHYDSAPEHHAGHDHRRRSGAQGHSLRAKRRFVPRARSRQRQGAVREEPGHGRAQPFRAVVQPEGWPRVCTDHRIAGIE